MSAVALALAGALLLWLPAFHLRIETMSCGVWPAPTATWPDALAYATAVALLSLGWLRAARASWSLGRALALGALVHAVAMVAPPFLSFDPLFYAAVGRTMAHGGSPDTPIASVLTLHDSLVALMPPSWRAGTSPYGPIVNQLAHALALAFGDNLTRQLRAYQALNALVLVAAAALTGRAFGPRAAAALLFSPIAIIDGTVNPHNDALLAVGSAAFALALARPGRAREGAGLVALAAGLAVKVSAALLLAWDVLRLALARIAPRVRRPARLLAIGAAAAVAAIAALVAGLRWKPGLTQYAALLSDPADPHPRFTRSIETLPRAALYYAAHDPVATWVVGLLFRAAAALWILFCAFRAAAARAPLAWAATMLFGYYLGLHAFMQTWYLLPLLPLAAALPEALQPSWRAYAVGSVAYYTLHIVIQCNENPVAVVFKEAAEALIVLLPATIRLLAAWRRARARASA